MLASSSSKPAEADIAVFVRMEVGDMTPELIRAMLALPESEVPPKLRREFRAKMVELHTYKQLGETRTKGTLRFPDKDCAIPTEAKSDDVKLLQSVGYVEAFEHEIAYLEQNSHCTERQMMCEFTLQIILEKRKGEKAAVKRYFLHAKDPLMALISEFRTKGGNRDTPFFGRRPFPVCQQ